MIESLHANENLLHFIRLLSFTLLTYTFISFITLVKLLFLLALRLVANVSCKKYRTCYLCASGFPWSEYADQYEAFSCHSGALRGHACPVRAALGVSDCEKWWVTSISIYHSWLLVHRGIFIRYNLRAVFLPWRSAVSLSICYTVIQYSYLYLH